jgi:hypothetical protein
MAQEREEAATLEYKLQRTKSGTSYVAADSGGGGNGSGIQPRRALSISSLSSLSSVKVSVSS